MPSALFYPWIFSLKKIFMVIYGYYRIFSLKKIFMVIYGYYRIFSLKVIYGHLRILSVIRVDVKNKGEHKSVLPFIVSE